MLKSFYIQNFRLFKEFSIENLGQINLIVGKNNSGKSCLLEALYVYAQNALPNALNSIIMNRGEDWEFLKQYINNEHIEATSPFRHLFYGYQIPKAGSDSIEIGPLHDINERIKLHVTAYQTIVNFRGSSFTRIDKKQPIQELDEVELVIELEEKGTYKRLIYLDRGYKHNQFIVPRSDPIKIKYNVQFVPANQFIQYNRGLAPANQFNIQQISNLWDNINVHPNLRQEVFKGLQLIDERIQEVVKIGDSKDATFILIYNESDERLPLNSMGDGMTHLFHIILGLVNARGGLLLIDEFENGLHYEVQPKIWELIYELSSLLKVQIFATTHSRDTINALQNVASLKGLEDKTKFIKLKPLPKKGIVKPVEISLDKLKSILEQEIEVR
ncbi:AAA ATPase-like domain-containing protein [Candidatus Magnetomoraceae bacterium gMMP-15]